MKRLTETYGTGYRLLASLAMIFVLLAGKAQEIPTTTYDKKIAKAVAIPSVPDNIKEPSSRAAYMLEKFWQGLDVNLRFDTSMRPGVEQSFVDFIQLFTLVDEKEIEKAVDLMYKRVEPNKEALTMLSDVCFKYLYEPESPFYNEDYYIKILKRQLQSEALDELEKKRPEFLLECAMKNRPGTPATDFKFTTPSKREMNLYDIKADNLILLFFDPDCHTCHELIEVMSESEEINGMIDSGKLAFVAIYPYDDKDAWEEYVMELPAFWTVGIDSGTIDADQLYVFPVIPSLYLLDKDKKVVLKDAKADKVVDHLLGE